MNHLRDTSLAGAKPAAEAGDDYRILVISQFGYSVRKGGARARMRSLLLEMRRLGYQIHFAGIRMGEDEKASTLPYVDEWVGDFAPRDPAASPAWLSRLWHRSPAQLANWLMLKVREPFRRWHWVEDRLDQEFHFHWLEQAQALQARRQYCRVMLTSVVYSKFFLAFPDPCLRILDTIDLLSYRRRKLRAKGLPAMARSLTPRDERRGLLRAHRVLALQSTEATAFRQLVGDSAQVCTVGHFAKLPPHPPARGLIPRVGCLAAPNDLNAQGVRWFVDEVWPRILERLPAAEAWMAGGASTNLPARPGVKILGQIPSVDDFYRECPVLVNPVQVGTGLKIKTIESLIHGRPIVATSPGGEGLDEFHGHGLITADSPAAFADALVRLLSDLPAAHALGLAALPAAQKYLAENHRVFAEALKI
ncbi:MAG TPA: glycosyltransferase [Opitutales bacterium]|nr:glycosyltransferase [Opitutales bacterium]